MKRYQTGTALALLMAFAHPASAQQAAIQGDVRDALGRPLAGVTLVLEGGDGKAVAQTTVDQNGHFSFPGVSTGTYAVVATKDDYDTATAVVSANAAGLANTQLVLRAHAALNMAVVAKQLDEARNNLSPQTGTSAYTIDSQAIADLPQGANTSFNQVLEQAPGVARDSYGQVHVRGEHANLQYRINGILLPEGISGFGQVLDSRIVDRAQLLTGALPAQYGYRTAGVVDIQTKSGAFEQGGLADFYGGSHSTMQPSLQYGGSEGTLNYFVTGSYLTNNEGIEPPTSALHPLHDHTDQGKGFGYFSYLLNPTNRLNVILGSSVGQFELPNNPGQSSSFSLNGAADLPSSRLKESQREENHYGTVALQGTMDDWGYQLAPYYRYSKLRFKPDTIGDLEYNGIASDVLRTNFATGMQGDGSYRVNDQHTLRSGVEIQHERAVANNSSSVFPLDNSGNALTSPETIVDDQAKNGMLYGVYLQDEWTLTDRLTMNYGARFDAVNAYVNETQLSPRLGFVYQLTRATTLHAGYARYFTPPPLELVASTSVDKFANTTGAPTLTQNDPVKSERSHNFDVGVTHKLTDRIQLGLDGYYKRVRNLLDEGQFGAALVYTPFNYAQGRIYGTEATLSYTGEKVTGYLNFAASRAVGKDIISSQVSFDDPAELAYISNHWVHLDHDQLYTASGGLSYQVLKDTRASMDSIFGSGLRKDFANTGHLPWYATLNLGVTQHLGIFDDSGIDVRLAVVNLFDTAYELRSGTGIGVGAPQFGERRGYYAGLSRKF
ncbi:TonB-dependent receptor [Telmatospirillum siberiense]|uniref:TonB-dependent receptor n=1 Tax=Telmatospirillum siberiense TaxID=382514 RepID=A0A2N3Q106_9PROT|nr:TonB-dependent receptor [Telmatospirillum siberiense]PKU26348.1 TonB-dependent receptor [Telmatospirillum siberiense]